MQTFEDVLHQAGYTLPPSIIKDGNIHRFGNKQRFWYVAHDEYAIAGDWKDEMQRVTWKIREDFSLSPNARLELKEKIQVRKKEYETEKTLEQFEAAKEAVQIINNGSMTGNSEYLIRKGAKAYGIRFCMDTAPYIAVPVRDVAGTVWSTQKIYNDGQKRFLSGGRKKGCFHVIGELSVCPNVYVCEGYATGATIHEATGQPVVICFDASNIEPVLTSLAPLYPVNTWIIAADNDTYSNINTGKIKAEEAAATFKCKVALPEFSDVIKEHNPTDFNDLAVLEGIEKVKKQLSVFGTLRQLSAVTLHDFLRLELPPREMMLDPIIPSQGLTMLYAMRGIGKTHVSLSIALAVSTGSATLGNKWKAEKPRRVLFVDGEMAAVSMQKRLAAFAYTLDVDLPSPDYLRIITPDLQQNTIPDLATQEGQQAVEEHLDGIELLILDNLSSLLRQGKENEAESWVAIQTWMLSLRRRGVSVLLVHHANKSGGQRGTSKKEDLLDTVIALKRVENYDSQNGAQFTVTYEKARNFCGEEAKSFEALLVTDSDGLHWKVKEAKDSMLQRALELRAEGLNQRQIGREIGCSASKVNRILNSNKQEGHKS